MMQMPQNAASLGQFGLPDAMRKQAVQNKVKQENAEFQQTLQKSAAHIHPNDRAIFNAVANLGRQVAQKIAGGTELDPQDIIRVRTVENANKEIQSLRETEEWATLDSGEQSLRTMEAYARAALDQGDVQTFAQISENINNQRTARAKAKKLAIKAGIDTDNATIEQGLKRKRGRNLDLDAQKKRNDIKIGDAKLEDRQRNNTFFVPGQDGVYKPIAGRIGDDGTLVGIDGERYVGALTSTELDQYTKSLDRLDVAEDDKKAMGDVDLVKRTNSFNSLVGVKNKADQFKAARDQVRIGSQVLNALKETVQDGNVAESISGTGGGIGLFADNVRSAVKGVTSTLKGGYNGVRLVNSDNETIGMGERDFAKFAEDSGVLDNLVNRLAPEDVEKAAEIKSNVIALSYAVARTNEEGGRFSDQDISRVMTQIGANYNNPESLRRTMTQLLTNKLSGVRNDMERIKNIDDRFQLDGIGFEAVYGPDAGVQEFIKAAAEFGETSESIMGIGTTEGDQAIREGSVVTPEQQKMGARVQSVLDQF